MIVFRKSLLSFLSALCTRSISTGVGNLFIFILSNSPFNALLKKSDVERPYKSAIIPIAFAYSSLTSIVTSLSFSKLSLMLFTSTFFISLYHIHHSSEYNCHRSAMVFCVHCSLSCYQRYDPATCFPHESYPVESVPVAFHFLHSSCGFLRHLAVLLPQPAPLVLALFVL